MSCCRRISGNDRWNLLRASQRVWDTFYPLGEENDLAFALGQLLFALDFYQEALFYFQLSVRIYGQDAGVLYNMALCHAEVGEIAASGDHRGRAEGAASR